LGACPVLDTGVKPDNDKIFVLFFRYPAVSAAGRFTLFLHWIWIESNPSLKKEYELLDKQRKLNEEVYKEREQMNKDLERKEIYRER
jgi:hypothetical protein